MKICLYTLFVIIAAILFEKIISNVSLIQTSISGYFSLAAKVLAPFLFGLFIAYILNPFVRWLENYLRIEKLSKKNKRILCSSIALLVFTGIIICIIAYILPEIVESIYSLVMSLPETLPKFQQEVENFITQTGKGNGLITTEFIQKIYEPIIQNFGSITEIASKVLNSTVSFGKGVLNFGLGLIIAFYMLIYKEGFKHYWIKILYVFMKPEAAEHFINNCRRANSIFEGFFVGKTIDSAIIGVLCFLIMNFFIQPKYILLSSVIIGVTNMIPFFGPFIGGIPVVIINLFYDFKLAAIVAVFIFILQQFDGYILGPKILGDSTGLSPFWVIAAILIGSAAFGILGMFLGVPIFAVLKLFLDEFIEKRFRDKYGRAPNKNHAPPEEAADNE